MQIIERVRRGGTVLAVSGELDVLTIPKLAARLDEALRRRSGDVVVDLRGTAFVDSAGLQILLNAQRRLIRQSRALAVLCRPGPVHRVIELARLEDTLGVATGFGEYRRRAVARERIRADAVSAQSAA